MATGQLAQDTEVRQYDMFTDEKFLTADQSPGTFSAGQSILLQSCVGGSVGFASVHCESGSVLNWPLDTS